MKAQDEYKPNEAVDAEVTSGVRTLSDARAWLARLAKDGAAQIEIFEPYQIVGGGLLLVTASLVREDGARVKIEVYCYDDRRPAPTATNLLFPLSMVNESPGKN